MIFTYREEFREEYAQRYTLYDKVSFFDDRVVQLCMRVNASYSDRIAAILNVINNQGITYIDPSVGRYTVGSNTLAMSKLSTAESVYCLAAIARIVNERVAFGHCMRQMSRRTLRRFFNEFGDYTGIAVVGDDDIDMEVLHATCLSGRERIRENKETLQ